MRWGAIISRFFFFACSFSRWVFSWNCGHGSQPKSTQRVGLFFLWGHFETPRERRKERGLRRRWGRWGKNDIFCSISFLFLLFILFFHLSFFSFFSFFSLFSFVLPLHHTALRRTALRWTTQNFARFFPLLPQFSFFLLSLVEFWWCLKGPSNVHVRALQTCTFEGPGASKKTPKFHEKTPREGRKERILRREREKKGDILGLPPFGAHPPGPHNSGPPFGATPFGVSLPSPNVQKQYSPCLCEDVAFTQTRHKPLVPFQWAFQLNIARHRACCLQGFRFHSWCVQEVQRVQGGRTKTTRNGTFSSVCACASLHGVFLTSCWTKNGLARFGWGVAPKFGQTWFGPQMVWPMLAIAQGSGFRV